MFNISETENAIACEFSTQPHNIDRAVDSVKAYFEPISKDIVSVPDLETLTRELLINAYEQGNKHDANKKIKLNIENKDNNYLLIRVADEGNEMNFQDSELKSIINNTYNYGHEYSFSDIGNTVTVRMPFLKKDSKVQKIIIQKIEDNRLILSPTSDLTASTAIEFRNNIIQALELNPREISLEMGSVNEIDSVSLNLLVLFGKKAKERNINIKINGLNESLNKLFWFTRLNEIFTLSNLI